MHDGVRRIVRSASWELPRRRRRRRRRLAVSSSSAWAPSSAVPLSPFAAAAARPPPLPTAPCPLVPACPPASVSASVSAPWPRERPPRRRRRRPWPSGSPSSCSGCWPSPPGPSLPAPAALRPRPPAVPAPPSGGGWKSTWGGWNVAAGTAVPASAAVPAASALPAGAPVAPGAPAAGLAKRMADGPAASGMEDAASEPPDGASGDAASVPDALARAGRRVVLRRPLAAGALSAPASLAGGEPPASAVFISGERAPLRSSPLGSASFSSVSSIRVISRQAPGHGGPQRGLRSAQELVARAHREVAGRGRLRSEARCLYLVICPVRARWPHGRPGWPPRVARHVRSGRFGGGAGRLHAEWPLRQPRHQGR
jgi:hypothetical protein